MIARDSKSYPYLAISQHYNVPYAEVLAFSEDKERLIYRIWQSEVDKLDIEMLHKIDADSC